MALDIYMKIPTDPYFDDDEIEIDDDIFNFVQNIEMILTTNKGDVFGIPEFGASLEAYLWNRNISPATIISDINKQIVLFCPTASNRIPYKVDVNFIKGDMTDSMVIDIVIDDQKVLGIVASPSIVPKNKN